MEKTKRFSARFLVLFAFWLILSGRLEIEDLIFGVFSAALVTFMTQDLPQPEQRWQAAGSGIGAGLKTAWRLGLYFLWLVREIIISNLQVAYLVLHPKLPIDPGLLRFRTQLRSRVGHVILANSITLTPGTITVDFTEGTYLVHALVPEAAGALLDQRMQSKLKAIFGEPEELQPEIRWVDDGGAVS